MASFDEERLIRRIRRAIGSPDDCAIDAEWVDDIIDDAIRRYSSYNPIREAVAVAVVEGVSAYPFPAGYLDVDHTVNVESDRVPDLTGYVGSTPLYGALNSGGGIANLHAATMNVRLGQHVAEDADRVFPRRKYWERGGQLVSEPPPCTTETTFVPLLKYHDCNTFPSLHIDELRLLSCSIACYEWAAHLSKFTEVKLSSDGVLKFRDPKWLRDEGARYFTEFSERMGSKGFGGVSA